MRIVAGEFRGRRIQPPPGRDTRPTSDRVREAVFSALVSRLGPDLGRGAVLDAFAGSGALGLEALSRGSSSATFVDCDRKALQALAGNVRELGVGHRARVITGNVSILASRNAISGGPFALLLLDPPYRLEMETVTRLLSDLAAHGSLLDGATVVWEHAAGSIPRWDESFVLASSKRYGTTEVDIAIYRKGTRSS
ncbi:MAG: 16S rRNA (guanine(966)-N(2))-methyltransferase RsmD [Coriobacteriia bacterium]